MEKIDLFDRSFADKPTRNYHCPSCDAGRLRPRLDTFKFDRPQFCFDQQKHHEWDPDWINLRFSCEYVCDNGECGEMAFASGNGMVGQRASYDETSENYWEYYEEFTIRSFFPSPRLASLCENVPESILEVIGTSYTLYWPDPASALSKLRTAIEVLMDELQIPRVAIDPNGKPRDLSLHHRLVAWEKQSKESSGICIILKDVGNMGVHGQHITAKEYCMALEVFCHVLEDLFSNKSERAQRLAAELRSKVKASKSVK